MYDRNNTGAGWLEGFFLLAAALWLMGALFVGTLVMLGAARVGDGSVTPASNPTTVAESAQSQ